MSISVFGGIILVADYQTATLATATIDELNEIDELLFVGESPVDFVVIAGAEIDHDVLVAVEEHDGGLVVEFVHFVEIGHLGNVDEINHSHIGDLLRHRVKRLVLFHAFGIPVVAKANNNDTIFFSDNSLIDSPSRFEMWKKIAL
jgi:hypothetical protein